MSQNELISKIEELKSLEELIAEAEQVAESLKDEIKNQMLTDNTEEMVVGQHIVRWTTILTQRFDSTAFKKALHVFIEPILSKAHQDASASTKRKALVHHADQSKSTKDLTPTAD